MTSAREENLDRFSNLNLSKNDINFLVYHYLIQDLRYAIAKYAKGDVFDIGCGNKPYAELFLSNVNSYKGCDVVQSSKNCVDVICEATNIPVGSSSFDTVISTQTIEHVADHRMLVAEAYRLLKPGGYFIVSGPMYWPLHEEPYDYFRFTKHGFKYVLNGAGFEVTEILSNGGKWALLGQAILITLPNWMIKPKLVRRLINSFFMFVDKKNYDEVSTMNYVIVAKK
ncbi:MAG: class I SAM-dependent methyltransferase [Ferruginibacter sp.]|nr:class I SAM-dependent methyltransferase [Ferruginibacter sp.]